jgi:F-type H+-transporting ATPase subunit delta
VSDVVSRRYAQALIDVAAAENATEPVGKDLDRFVALLRANDNQLGEPLGSPVFTVEERRGVLDAVLPAIDLHPLVANLLRLANDKGRMTLVPAIAEAYRDLADRRADRVRVIVETAEPLTPQLEIEVRASLEVMTGMTVLLESRVKPELIGGIVARVGDKVYDSSLRTRLEQMRQTLLRTPVAEA